MMVAYTLQKTLGEMADMPLTEINEWLAFFNVYQEKEAQAAAKEARKQRMRR